MRNKIIDIFKFCSHFEDIHSATALNPKGIHTITFDVAKLDMVADEIMKIVEDHTRVVNEMQDIYNTFPMKTTLDEIKDIKARQGGFSKIIQVPSAKSNSHIDIPEEILKVIEPKETKMYCSEYDTEKSQNSDSFTESFCKRMVKTFDEEWTKWVEDRIWNVNKAKIDEPKVYIVSEILSPDLLEYKPLKSESANQSEELTLEKEINELVLGDYVKLLNDYNSLKKTNQLAKAINTELYKRSNWISIKDSQPSEGEEVLAYRDGIYLIGEIFYNVNNVLVCYKKSDEDNEEALFNPTHFQYLTQPS